MVAAGQIDGEALFGIDSSIAEVAQTHIDASQQVQAIGLALAVAAVQGQSLGRIAARAIILVLVVVPFCRPVPYLLTDRVERC